LLIQVLKHIDYYHINFILFEIITVETVHKYII
jgi:hypothetical protein